MRKALALVGAAGLAAIGVAAIHGPAGATTARAPQAVTLKVERYYFAPTKSHRFRFSGSISSRVAEEYVAVMHQRCDQSFATAVAGTQTDASGLWRTDPTSPLFAGAGTFEARWKEERSASVRVRPPIQLTAVNLGKGKARVTVSTYDIQQDLKGRAVVLERLRNGTWSEVRRGKLARDAGGGYASWVFTFTYPVRGATLRASVPAATAAPCFARATTKKWKS